MDWLNVFIVLLFFVLPLIQQIVEHARKRKNPPEWEQEEGEWSEPPNEEWARADAPLPQPEATAGGGWSDGWSKWPGFDDGEKEEESPLIVPKPAESARIDFGTPIEPSAPPPVWAPARVPPTIRTVAPPAETRRRQVIMPVKRTSRLTREMREVRSALRDPAGVRKALIAREILNRPLSLREMDPEG